MRTGKRSESASLAAGLLAGKLGEALRADGTSAVWRTDLGKGTLTENGDRYLQGKVGLLDTLAGGWRQGGRR